MNPASMPKAFCTGTLRFYAPQRLAAEGLYVAQVLVTGLAAFFLIGVLAAITTATTFYVAKPKQWGLHDNNVWVLSTSYPLLSLLMLVRVLPWRYYYLLPMLFFPLLASAVHITFVVFFDSFDPVDGLSCAAHPLWRVNFILQWLDSRLPF
jgi:hypothetical protein